MPQIAAFATKDVLHGGWFGALDAFGKATKPERSRLAGISAGWRAQTCLILALSIGSRPHIHMQAVPVTEKQL